MQIYGVTICNIPDYGTNEVIGIDVLDKEGFFGKRRVFSLVNVFLSPHISWYREELSIDQKRKDKGQSIKFYYTIRVDYKVNKYLYFHNHIEKIKKIFSIIYVYFFWIGFYWLKKYYITL